MSSTLKKKVSCVGLASQAHPFMTLYLYTLTLYLLGKVLNIYIFLIIIEFYHVFHMIL